MSWKAMEWARQVDCGGPTAKLVLLLLASRHNIDENVARPSISGIARDGNMSRDTVVRNLKKLQDELGLIEVVHRSDGAVRLTNHYRLNFELRVVSQSDYPPQKRGQGVVAQSDQGSDTATRVVRQSDQGGSPTVGHTKKDNNHNEPKNTPYPAERGSGLFEGEVEDPAPSQTSSPPKQPQGYTPEFEEFWKAYPPGADGNRRKQKGEAFKAYKQARKTYDHQQIMTAIQRYAKFMHKIEKEQFIPYPQKWLKREVGDYLGDEWEDKKQQMKPPKDDSWRYMV